MMTKLSGINKGFALLVLSTLIISGIYAQDAEMLAKSNFLAAEEAYQNSQFSSCVSYLNQAESTLGKSNKKIKYLKVKAYFGSEDYDNAKSELSKYFEFAKGNTDETDEKYMEMVKMAALIDQKKAEKQQQQQQAERQQWAQTEQKKSARSAIENEIKAIDKNIKDGKKGDMLLIWVGIGTAVVGGGLILYGVNLSDQYDTFKNSSSYKTTAVANYPPDGSGLKIVGFVGVIGGGVIAYLGTLSDYTVQERKKSELQQKLASFSFRYTPMLDNNYRLCSGFTFKATF